MLADIKTRDYICALHRSAEKLTNFPKNLREFVILTSIGVTCIC
jgi:hypothetical protein